MVKIVGILLAALAGLLVIYTFVFNEKSNRENIRVYAYSSFSQPWSAGPRIVEAFEKRFDQKVELIDAGDSALLMQKLKMDPTPVDLVIGLDQDSFSSANFPKDWRPIDLDKKIQLAAGFQKKWLKRGFVAVEWSPLTFMVRKDKLLVPESWEDLLKPDYKNTITLPDPRTSNLGWQFIKWLITDKGQEGAIEYLKKFRSQVFAAPASWSASYGLFQSGQSHMSFTYLTSLLYHEQQEKNSGQYVVTKFAAGHIVQIEYAGIPEKCNNCSGAEEFLKFVLNPESQKILIEKNYMLPVVGDPAIPSYDTRLPILNLKEAAEVVSPETKKYILDSWVGLWQ